MTRIRIKGFKIFNDRHGKKRGYHRQTNIPIDLNKHPIGSAGFIAECERIAALSNCAEKTKPGTLGMLIKHYRDHPQFRDLAPRTRSDYQRIFDYLMPIADTLLNRFSPPLVVKIRDKAAEKMGRKWGNCTKTVLSVVFGFGVERDFVNTNPAFRVKGIRRPKNAPQPNRPWTDDERQVVLAALPPQMMVPITLMMYCGLDPKDALEMQRSSIQGGLIDLKRAKTGEPVWIPLPKQVQEALKNAPKHSATTVCASVRGRPWTINGFGTSWYKLRKKLLAENRVSPGLTLKGLRHTVATILAEMGHDDRTIADVLGQKTLAMAQHYSNRANRSRKLTPVIKSFDEEMDRRSTKIVKPT